MKRKVDNFSTALQTLEEFVAEPIASKRDIAGVLQGFGFTFELAWRAVQDEIAVLGYLERGPKLSLKAAFESGLIDPAEEEVWAEMVEDRNLVAHTYRFERALELVERIKSKYLGAFKRLLSKLGNQQ